MPKPTHGQQDGESQAQPLGQQRQTNHQNEQQYYRFYRVHRTE